MRIKHRIGTAIAVLFSIGLWGSAAYAQPKTILDVLHETDGAQTLVAAVETGDEAGCLGDIQDTLDDRKARLVVFAPTNGAFEKLLQLKSGDLDGQDIGQIKSKLQALLNSVELTEDDLCGVLLKHVAVDQRKKDSSAAKLLESGQITMADGSEFPISVGSLRINYESNITRPDVFTQNGVIHYVDNVIVDAPPPTPDAVTVFSTSQTYTGNFGGLVSADTLCGNAAAQAGLAGDWKAWLSDDTENAKDRIPLGEYRLVDGTLIANDLNDLLEGRPLKNAPFLTQFGEFPPQEDVWTGTDSDGMASGTDCMGWMVGDAADESCAVGDDDCGSFGSSRVTNTQWTELGPFEEYSTGSGACYIRRALYCFGIPQ